MSEWPFRLEDLAIEIEKVSPSSLAAHMDPTRPYDGQPHTDLGIRGAHQVEGVTMRDITDAFFRACFEASGLPIEEWPGSIYDLPWEKMDPIAVSHGITNNIEKMMGIYPNVPRLLPVDPTEDHWCGPDINTAIYRSHEGTCQELEAKSDE